MRWAGLALVIGLLVLGFVAYADPALFPANVGDRLPRLIYLGMILIYLGMILLLVSGAGFGFTRIRSDRARILPAILLWAAAFALVIFLYNLFHPSE